MKHIKAVSSTLPAKAFRGSLLKDLLEAIKDITFPT
jgi:hypothetical protein